MAEEHELTSMAVSLPASQKAFVKDRSVATGCSTPSEYIRRLIHADHVATETDELERKLLEGLASPGREIGAGEWQELRETLRKKLARRRRAE